MQKKVSLVQITFLVSIVLAIIGISLWLFFKWGNYYVCTKNQYLIEKNIEIEVQGVHFKCNLTKVEIKRKNPSDIKKEYTKYDSLIYGEVLLKNKNDVATVFDLVRLNLLIKGKFCPISSKSDMNFFEMKLGPNEFEKFDVYWVYEGELKKTDAEQILIYWNLKKWNP